MGNRLSKTNSSRFDIHDGKCRAHRNGSTRTVRGMGNRGQNGYNPGRTRCMVHGFTADYVAGVWMGYDDNTPLTGSLGRPSRRNWRETMAYPVGATPKPLPMSRNIVATGQSGAPIQGSSNENAIDRLLRGIFGPDQPRSERAYRHNLSKSPRRCPARPDLIAFRKQHRNTRHKG